MRKELEPLIEDPAAAAIICDIDGTLAPIVALPTDAAVPERTRAVLRELAAGYARVACLSGRRALDARELVGVDELLYVGNHGLELLEPGAGEARLDPAISDQAGLATEFVAALDAGALDALGVRREDKGPIQTLHWRGAERERDAERELREIAATAEERGIEPRWGRKVLELRPRVRIDKGTAARRVVTESGVSRALFGGDDVTDLDGFRALRAMRDEGELEHAVCVGVSSEEEPADLRRLADLVVDGTEGYLELLEALGPDR